MSEFKTALKTTPRYIKILEENGITTIKKFLQYFPRTYEDRSQIINLSEINLNEKNSAMIKGKILEKKFFQRGGKKIYEISFEDTTGAKGFIGIFGSSFLAQQIKTNQRYIIIGKTKFQYGKIQFTHPEMIIAQAPNEEDEKKEEYNIGRIYPIYPELQGIKPGWFARKMREILHLTNEHFDEHLPKNFLETFKLKETKETIKHMHYPDTIQKQKKAIERIFFDRLLRIQLFSLINKSKYQENKQITKEQTIDRKLIKNFLSKLPFQLTNAQKKVIKTIIEDLHEEQAMIRLLQGDVGSGKTIVATISAYYTHKIFNAQTVFLAPLEVLATQHHKNLAKLLLPLGIRVELLKGSMSKQQKEKIKADLAQGKIHIIIGTHAIIQDDVKFKNLQLAVVDEQHKFGVKQRAFFKRYGSPHILQMSATPIPRSMALAFFGEFSISIIDELPVGRKTIHTKIISETERRKLKPRVLDKIKQGQKVFIVTPLIEESEKLENIKSATQEFEEITNLYKEIKGKIGLLHGKMKAKEKDEIMKQFKEGKLNILISTTVIEVGIDIPEATIMIIKNAERFGLSQLHQLRGRIGRSNIQSYCFLETPKRNSTSYKRLKAMEETSDGFKLAEMDLQERGAGEILGLKQSGEADIPIEILSDINFIQRVQTSAEWLLKKYPNLEGIPKLKKFLNEKLGDILA